LPQIVDRLGTFPVQIHQAALAKALGRADGGRAAPATGGVIFLRNVVDAPLAEHPKDTVQPDTGLGRHFFGVQMGFTGQDILYPAEVDVFFRLAIRAHLGDHFVEEFVAPCAFRDSKIQASGLQKSLPKYTTTRPFCAQSIS
jgi:hypothetical protein